MNGAKVWTIVHIRKWNAGYKLREEIFLAFMGLEMGKWGDLWVFA